jgi:hypothetical protein
MVWKIMTAPRTARPKACCLCKRPYTQEELDAKNMLRAKRIKTALKDAKENGFAIGRPRHTSYEKIRELRRHGHSIRKIAKIIKCSTGTVQAAIKEVE